MLFIQAKINNISSVVRHRISVSMFSLAVILVLSGQALTAIADTITTDPITIAEQHVSQFKNTITFKSPKSFEQVSKYITKQMRSPKNTILALGFVNLETQSLDIPFSFDNFKSESENREVFEQSKRQILNDLKSYSIETNPQAPKTFQLGDIQITKSEAKKISSQTIEKSEFGISQLQFTTDDNQKLDYEIGSLKTKPNIKIKTNTNINVEISNTDIEYAKSTGFSDEEKLKIRNQAKQIKEGIKQKENERYIGEVITKPLKQKAIEEQKNQRKIKKEEVVNKIKSGQKSQITIDDVYLLGEEGLDIGLEIIPTQDENKKPTIKIDESKSQKYQQQISWVERLLKIGQIKSEAFSPQQSYVSIYHSTPNTHYGTVMELYGGNQSNGAQIGLWSGHGGWNQKFYMMTDHTIRIAGKCVDLSGNQQYNGNRIQLWDCNNGDAQRWVYDTEGNIRLKSNTSWCLDVWYGGVGQNVMLWQCAGNTEKFRGGEYEMRIYSRGKTNIFEDVGHAFVGVARYNQWNWVSQYSTYSLWPNPKDDDDQNNFWKYQYNSWNQLEYADKKSYGWWDNVNVNNNSDMQDGYSATQDANYTNPPISYWQKNITSDEYWDLTNNKFFDGQSNYAWQGSVCTIYSTNFWHKYNGKYLWFLTNTLPVWLHNTLKSTQIYD